MEQEIKYGDMEREELIEELKTVLCLEESKLSWALLCNSTEFDSFTTCFALGFGWQEEDMQKIPLSKLRVALFNINNFPKKIQKEQTK